MKCKWINNYTGEVNTTLIRAIKAALYDCFKFKMWKSIFGIRRL